MHVIHEGIFEVPKTNFIKKMFCKHEFIVAEECSPHGLTRISGQDMCKLCKHCGKIVARGSREYY